VYSSGAGIAFRLIHENLLGLRRGRSSVVIDPVLPRALDGLAIDADLGAGPMRIEYRVGARGCGPVSLTLDGSPLAFEREANPYRQGGAVVPTAALRGEVLIVELG
jgi:CRISPR-associated protein Csx3